MKIKINLTEWRLGKLYRYTTWGPVETHWYFGPMEFWK